MKPEIDLAAALSFATADPDWPRKVAVAGLCVFVPLAGPFVLLGWEKRLMEQALTATEIPPVEFGPDLIEGLRVSLALLVTMVPAVVVLFAVQCVGIVPALMLEQIESEGARALLTIATSLLTLVGVGVFTVLIFAFQVLMPDLLRRIFRGELAPSLTLGRTLRAIKRSPTPYLVAFAGMVLANLVGSIGAFACFVGLVVTYPLSLLILAHILAQWDRIAETA